MKKEGEEIAPGKWTEIETLILLEVVNVACIDDPAQICQFYNAVNKTARINGLECNVNNKQQIKAKLAHFERHNKLKS